MFGEDNVWTRPTLILFVRTAIVACWQSQYWGTMPPDHSELSRSCSDISVPHAARCCHIGFDKARSTLLHSGWSREEDKLPFCWRMLLALIHTSQVSDLRHIFSGLSMQVHTAKTLREFSCPVTFYNKLLDIYREIPGGARPPQQLIRIPVCPRQLGCCPYTALLLEFNIL